MVASPVEPLTNHFHDNIADIFFCSRNRGTTRQQDTQGYGQARYFLIPAVKEKWTPKIHLGGVDQRTLLFLIPDDFP